MDLFTSKTSVNLLPYDGIADYYGKILDKKQADKYYENLLNKIEWKNDEAVIFGKHIITKRKVAWYGSTSFAYTYSNITKHALLWTDELLELKQEVEKIMHSTYNSCLLNLYHTGNEGMAWHSDGEKALAKNAAIASLSFGAERKFSFKHKRTQLTASVVLEHGSLLLMRAETQTHWLHRLPPAKNISKPRVDLTFRTIAL